MKDVERWQKISALFAEVLDVEPTARQSWLAARSDDANLVDDVLKLIHADTSASARDFMSTPLPDAASLLRTQPDEKPIDRFGPYRLLRLLGQGGMGEVHLAERDDGVFEQRVALKLVPLPTPGLLERFARERQILAHLQHPNIARLLDGGVGARGIPYFAMEYVEGVTITQYLANAQLDVPATLRLMLAVCDAVQHAHRSLIVHRDLKPSNVLVDAGGNPKLLDFGIAKLLAGTGDDASHTRVYTASYAAPEQLRGEPITTATDVYALGVLLYEMLIGAKPFAADDGTLRRQPPLPSAAAAHRSRRRAMQGDVDRIVTTAMAYLPNQRYGSVEALASDMRQYLAGKPIAARGDSSLYRLRTFIRRNRVLVTAGLVFAVGLVVATTVSLYNAHVAARQTKRAEAESATAAAEKDFLLAIFSSANPYNTEGHTVTARDLLEGGYRDVATKLAGQPQVQAELYSAFRETFLKLDRFDLSVDAARKSLSSYRSYLPDDDLAVLRAQTDLGESLMWAAPSPDVADHFKQVLNAIGERGGEYRRLQADVFAELALLHFRAGAFDASVEAGEEAVAALRSVESSYSYDLGVINYHIALARLGQGRLLEAAALIDDVVQGDFALIPPLHPGFTTDLLIIGRYLRQAGRLPEAERILKVAVAAREQQFPAGHAYIGRARAMLAGVRADMDDATSAEPMLAAALRNAQTKPDLAAVDLSEMLFDHARILVMQSRYADASTELDTANRIMSKYMTPDAPLPLAAAALRAEIERRKGNAVAAAVSLRNVASRQRVRRDRELPATLLYLARAESETAVVALDEARSILQEQGRQFSATGRDVEQQLMIVDVPYSSTHATRLRSIACVNFGCPRAQVWEQGQRVASATRESEGARVAAMPDYIPGARELELANKIIEAAQHAREAEGNPPPF